ncbi:AfsR/SARP family transcriptional regulator [Saccharothrix obliqua]|uniref:AfsR/SARP family transcriptional regulator n=1 Tax=Saccharothrix obliqua TaxID=2861747 RepID=UPI001C5F3D4D|nr:BTAD domain-containing putative transcriptional regulator [Saccharothrix obliqua]MBW4721491.1 tetratricopeptide repeat protein [Saccharothrix obliqua]
MGELRVLGAVEAWAGATRVDLGHAQQRCVLVALVVDANRVVSADRLVDRAWGERVPHRWRETLYSYLSRLRRALDHLPDTAIVRRAGGWELAVPPDSVDLHRFRGLLARNRGAGEPPGLAAVEEALALWRGEPFAGLDTPWIGSVRHALDREREAAELHRTDLALRAGRHAELLPGLAVRAREHPLDQRVAAQYLVALYRSGRQADALAHYRATRDRLVEELGVDPGPELQALHRRVLNADITLTTPAPAPDRLVPRQLPPPPPHFVGRAGELDVLTATLEGGTTGISVLTGAGGIGKTSLALHWAHRHADRFPDGQLFVDLRGFSPAESPVAPREVVRDFLTALGVAADRVPDELNAMVALFRSLVADKRVLLVLDNAANSDQVTPLLPGTRTSTVLITSRTKPESLVIRHGACCLQLDVLPHDEAYAVLVGRLGRARVDAERGATGDLVGLCGHYPLALSIAARHAAARPSVTLAELAAELRELGLEALSSDTDTAAGLPSVLSWSLRGLTSRQRTVLALLGIAPGPDVGLPAAASLAGLPPRETRRVLRALENASLVERKARGRYAMHDVIRKYAAAVAEELAEPTRTAALRRVVDFYLHSAYHAERILDPHAEPVRLDPPAPDVEFQPLPDQSAAMAWLDVEHPHLLAAQRTARARGWHDVVWQLAWTLTTFHTRRGHRNEELTVWQAAVAASARLADPTAGIVAHRVLGTAHGRLGRYEEAIHHLYQALSLAEHDPTQQALTHRHLPWILERLGDVRRALEHANRALELHRALGQPVGEARALNSAGWYAARLGDYRTAEAHCRAALELHREHGNPTGEANARDSLGYIAQRLGHHDQAVDHYTRALARFRALGYTYEVANTLDNLGHPLVALGRHDEARAAWHEAVVLFRRQGREADADRVHRQLTACGAADPPDVRVSM